MIKFWAWLQARKQKELFYQKCKRLVYYSEWQTFGGKYAVRSWKKVEQWLNLLILKFKELWFFYKLIWLAQWYIVTRNRQTNKRFCTHERKTRWRSSNRPFSIFILTIWRTHLPFISIHSSGQSFHFTSCPVHEASSCTVSFRTWYLINFYP